MEPVVAPGRFILRGDLRSFNGVRGQSVQVCLEHPETRYLMILTSGGFSRRQGAKRVPSPPPIDASRHRVHPPALGHPAILCRTSSAVRIKRETKREVTRCVKRYSAQPLG